MPVSTEAIKQDIDRLTHNQLQQVADFIAFLKVLLRQAAS
jgi:hypothetical protein